ncbi:hypothetical protein FISHEDRAFT_59870 [Fistulina hepatica ATCC 64428]|uniref:Uncharacterized protein n=1 Tax=Fistulina hepatica ATCC 64428 TaxID=1128425 RepID=A0A0D7A8J4_9AGAR|nr:hypothetical protein FISHEDRAFT_59870 [Fistulina hepatica ATCC 64428]
MVLDCTYPDENERIMELENALDPLDHLSLRVDSWSASTCILSMATKQSMQLLASSPNSIVNTGSGVSTLYGVKSSAVAIQAIKAALSVNVAERYTHTTRTVLL